METNRDYYVHVIVPVYNTEKYIAKCLNSILNQTYKHFDIICVDDGSSDKSLEILKDFASRYPQISVYSQKNGGASSARNFGINKCENNGYICFVDADDYLDVDHIETLIDGAKEFNADVCYYGNIETLKDDKVSAFIGPILYGPLRGPVRKIVKTNIVKETMFKNELYVAEDLVFDFECFNKCKTFKVVDFGKNAKYNVVQNDSSLTRSLISQKRIMDSYLGWYLFYLNLIPCNFLDSDYLKQLSINILAEEFLELYGSYKVKKDSYKKDKFIETKKFIRDNKIIKLYKPSTKFKKFKKIAYVWFKPFYKLIRKVYKR